jgi:hypothetical protein
MSKADEAELHAIQLQALEYLQNLRSFEVSGTDVQVGTSTEAIQEGTGCANAHQTTLKRLIAILFHYYRRMYGTEDLQETVLRLITSTPTPSDNPLDDATVEEIQEGSKDPFIATVLDIRALEQMLVDMAVAQCYLDPRVTVSPTGFLQIVPTLSEVYRTPLFATMAQEFYTLIVDNFDQLPARAEVSWKTSEKIRKAFYGMHPGGLHFHRERGCQASCTLFPLLRKTLARWLETLAAMSSTSALTNKHLTSIFTQTP